MKEDWAGGQKAELAGGQKRELVSVVVPAQYS